MAKTGKRPPREGFRRRVNPYYGNMNRKEIAADVAKTVFRCVMFAVLAFVYWLAMLLIFSIILLNVWKVSFVEILAYSGILCGISSLVFVYIQVHKKLYY